jgi:ABC-type uncharacterized transport system ATPase subunit
VADRGRPAADPCSTNRLAGMSDAEVARTAELILEIKPPARVGSRKHDMNFIRMIAQGDHQVNSGAIIKED